MFEIRTAVWADSDAVRDRRQSVRVTRARRRRAVAKTTHADHAPWDQADPARRRAAASGGAQAESSPAATRAQKN